MNYNARVEPFAVADAGFFFFLDTDTDMFIWSLIQVHLLFPNK